MREATKSEQQDTIAQSENQGRLLHRLRRSVLIYVVTPYVVVVLFFVLFQRRFMYRPVTADSLAVADAGLNNAFARDVQITTPDRAMLNGWLVNHQSSASTEHDSAPLVIYFPGNSLNRGERISDLREVAARGFDVLMFDYRGYGDSSGSPTESALSADARLVWNYARDELGYDEHQIVVFGESLGGAVALSLWDESASSPPQPAALILSSTFASMPATVAWHYPAFPFQYFLLDRWPSAERIPQVESPVTIFHGTDDQLIPLSHAQQLAQAAVDVRLMEIPGGTHNDIPLMQLRAELNRIHAELAQSASR